MRILAMALLMSAAPAAVLAQDQVYQLGELQITAQDRTGEALGGAVISGETLQVFGKDTVDKALDLIPGTAGSNTGGSRNERLIYVRGFDRFQTTLSIDGVRVFLPADNRIDFGRFLTADLSEIQVSKGYVPVIDGPGGLGGAINLVTRKPTKALEAELRATSYLDRDASQEAYGVSGLIGGKRGDFYAQISGAYTDRDYYTLSENFRPTALEDGGARGNSSTRDWRVNAKAGWTPREGGEYSINYTQQSGEKNAPYHVADTANTRFWSWPYWDLSSLYFLSKTEVSDKLTVRSRLYRNTFENALFSFDSAAQTVQSLPRAFRSYYDDTATGGNIEADYAITDTDLLKAAFYVRSDEHKERQEGFVRVPATGNPFINAPYSEPFQTTKENTYSFALENRMGFGDDIDLIVGASYDWTDLKRAEEFNVFVTGTPLANAVINQVPVSLPRRNDNALNGQAAVVWRVSDDTKLHASISSRTRFATLFERFSSRMGAAIPNPDVKAERSTNYEIGAQKTFAPGLEASGAIFYSNLTDALVLVPQQDPVFGLVNKTKNFGKGEYYGAEGSVKATLSDTLEIGGNYTWLHRTLSDSANPNFKPQGVPEHKAFLYAAWRPIEAVTITPNVEIAGDRWTIKTAPTAAQPVGVANAGFYETGDYVLVNLNVEWTVNERVSLSAGAQNISDESYALADGFPEAGRSFYTTLRLRY